MPPAMMITVMPKAATATVDVCTPTVRRFRRLQNCPPARSNHQAAAQSARAKNKITTHKPSNGPSVPAKGLPRRASITTASARMAMSNASPTVPNRRTPKAWPAVSQA